MPELSVNNETCTHCGLCAEACPWRIIALPEGRLPHFVDEGAERCSICGHCEAVCPAGAITVDAPRLDTTVSPFEAWDIRPERLGAYLRMRRSVRRYREEPVERAVITRIMDICRYAPTGRNRQDVAWLVIHDTGDLRRLTALAVEWMRTVAGTDSPFATRFNVPAMLRAWEEGRDPFCHHAPHLVIAHVPDDSPVARTNAVIALAHLEIVAPAFGLATCWGGIFQLAVSCCEPLREALDLPPGHVPVHCLMLGYPAIRYQRPPRRNPASVAWR